ncbi:MAG TPA: type IX secretion system membrane protein PorP/SprF [Bacteroidia bacterium]|nr:type IX secretion system membrane protein PorP/SprF [Bacteroidia bacterium]HNT80664.1 type IX secretion system membrane protein PorP/SprF [Bacteroidia bacterium]
MKKLLIILSLLVLVCIDTVHAQQQGLLSQYLFNDMPLNPAYSGTKEYVSSAMLYRKQWSSFPGAPESALFNIHTPIKNKRIGLGLTALNDKIGVTTNNELSFTYAYHLPLSQAKLSLGLRGVISQVKTDFGSLVYFDQSDPVYTNQKESKILPNAGFGILFHSERVYAGVSLPYLLSYDPEQSLSVSSTSAFKQTRHYYFSSGVVVPVSSEIELKPAVLIKYVHGAEMQYDASLSALISRTLWLGASYRSADAIVLFTHVQVSKSLRVGYAYDIINSSLKNNLNNSHELMLGYDFGFKQLKIKNPRFF